MKRIIPYKRSGRRSRSIEQALLRRDIPALEQIWSDDYFFVNAIGEMPANAQPLANLQSGATTLESINEDSGEKNLQSLTHDKMGNKSPSISRSERIKAPCCERRALPLLSFFELA